MYVYMYITYIRIYRKCAHASGRHRNRPELLAEGSQSRAESFRRAPKYYQMSRRPGSLFRGHFTYVTYVTFIRVT